MLVKEKYMAIDLEEERAILLDKLQRDIKKYKRKYKFWITMRYLILFGVGIATLISVLVIVEHIQLIQSQ